MQTWFSVHIYPLETLDVLLNRSVRPFLETHIWPNKETRAFFIRFEDEQGPHIRLRLRAEADFLKNTLETAVYQHFEGRGNIQTVAYQAEPERFGGTEALTWAEEFFHQSSRVTLERLKQVPYTYGDALFDALRLHTITMFAAGFKPQKVGWYFGQLCDQWLSLFFAATENDGADWQNDLKSDFAKTFEPQRFALVNALDRFWKDLEKGKIDRSQAEWLRWLRANELILKGLGDNLEKALPSLLHLTNNRLGINNQDEVYVVYILSKAF